MDDRTFRTEMILRIASRLGFFVLLSLLVSGLIACSAPSEQSPKPGSQISSAAPPESNSSLQSNVPHYSQDSHDQQPAMNLRYTDQKLVLSIPVLEQTQVKPDYEHPIFQLNFSPTIPRCTIPDLPASPLVQTLQPLFDPEDPNRLQALKLTTKSRLRYLVSRPAPSLVRLLIAPVLEQDSSSSEAEAQALSDDSLLLQDIRFRKDQDNNQLIALTTTRPVQYTVLPSAGNQIQLLFKNMHVPPALLKLYRLHEFQTSVQRALLRNSSKGGILTLQTLARSPIHVQRSDHNSLILRISNAERSMERQGTASLAPNDSNQNFQQTGLQDGESETQAGSTLKKANPEPGRRYSGQPISIDLQDAQVEHILRLIESVAGYSFVLGQDVQGKMSLRLHNVPWDQALDIVLKELNLKKEVLPGNILRIITYAKYNREQEQEIQEEQQRAKKLIAQREKQKTEKESAPLSTRYIQVNYTTASQLEPQLQSFLTERGKLSSDSRTNQLIVHDTASSIQTIQSVVRRLDRPEQQVLIEARLVYITDEFQRQMGIKWGGGLSYESVYHGDTFKQGLYGTSGSITADSSPDLSGFAVNLPTQGTAALGIGGFISKLTGSDLYTLDAQLQLGESQNQVQTISSPRVLTLNNFRAQMSQGTKIATQAESESGGTTTEYVEAVLDLSVLPQITPDKKIILDLEISDDSPTGAGDDIETRSATTKLIVDNEETIVIGGVQQLQETGGSERVPGVSSIPLLGWLFRNTNILKTKRELLIFIHPKIIE